MNPAEVIEHVVQRNRVAVIVHFLAESICEPSEAAHVHPHCEILPFHERGAYMLWIGIPADHFHVTANALRGEYRRDSSSDGAP